MFRYSMPWAPTKIVCFQLASEQIWLEFAFPFLLKDITFQGFQHDSIQHAMGTKKIVCFQLASEKIWLEFAFPFLLKDITFHGFQHDSIWHAMCTKKKRVFTTCLRQNVVGICFLLSKSIVKRYHLPLQTCWRKETQLQDEMPILYPSWILLLKNTPRLFSYTSMLILVGEQLEK